MRTPLADQINDNVTPACHTPLQQIAADLKTPVKLGHQMPAIDAELTKSLQQPPLICVELTAVSVELVREDYGRSDLRVALTLDREVREAPPGTPTLKDFHRAQLTLGSSYAAQFCAGQKFILTITPAEKP
jgi:hypothetical protein